MLLVEPRHKNKRLITKRNIASIGVVAIVTLGTQALPNKERNLSIRDQKVFKY